VLNYFPNKSAAFETVLVVFVIFEIKNKLLLMNIIWYQN